MLESDRKAKRYAAVQWQDRLFPGLDLPSICMLLRAGVNGSADEWESSRVRETLDMLGSRLDSWYESNPETQRVDDAVKELVKATRLEVW